MRAGAPDNSPGQTALSVPDAERSPGATWQPFFEACGGVQSISLSTHLWDNPAAADRHVFRKPFCIIGRTKASDLVIPDPMACYRHIYVQLISGRWFFINLAMISKSAVVRGQPESGWFDIDRQLKVGSHVVTRVATVGEANGPVQFALAKAAPAVDLPFFNLEILNRAQGSREPLSFQYCAPITLIGANAGCDLFLSDESVSKVHCSLVLTPQGLWVVDLLGRGGVFVDGNRGICTQVHDGTILQIGRFRLRVRFDSSRMMATRPDNRDSTRSAPLLVPGAVTGESLPNGALLTLIGQLAEMQNQFLEQSRLQMQWMADMMAHVGRAHQESARRDFLRFEEITQELREIKTQLAGGTARHLHAPNGESPVAQGRLSSVTTTLNLDVVEPQENSADVRTSFRTGEAPPTPQTIDKSLPDSLQEREQMPEPGLAPRSAPRPETTPDLGAKSAGKKRSSRVATVADAVPGDATQPVLQQSTDERNAPPPGSSSVDTHAWLTQRMAALSQEHMSLWRRLMNSLAGTPNP